MKIKTVLGKLNWLMLVLFILATLTMSVLVRYGQRPLRQHTTTELFPGIVYTRQVRSMPRPLMLHLVKIDLAEPHIDLLVTPGDKSGGLDIPARTTSRFAEEFQVQMAINGSFFKPFDTGRYFIDYYPHKNDPVDVLGLAISDGQQYSEAQTNRSVLCIFADFVEIHGSRCPRGTLQALAGNHIVVQDGYAKAIDSSDTLYPRTAVAINETGNVMWLIVIDGRQPGYSEGVTLAELAEIVLELGASDALNLDGGGSSTLVQRTRNSTSLLNSPIHQRTPMRERPVANHLGVYVQPFGKNE